MTKTIAIFGAGSGLGTAVAHRFGKQGYKVALVARRREPLDSLAADLGSGGIEAAVFTADLAHSGNIAAVVSAIRHRFGSIDAVYYAPVSVIPFFPAQELPVEVLRNHMELFVYTPLVLAQAVLPEMLDRGEGTILMPHGLSGHTAFPFMSGPGPAAAALRNFLQSLHGEVGAKGIYVGMLWIGALIQGSEFHRQHLKNEAGGQLTGEFPQARPDELADILWELATRKDRFEAVYPPQS
ncbi:SDR family NAD(P)-dependent oxidoreductase [Labrys neptuniae]|uniref:SDR family NAD(P)-dependent oxidoreductase n=1 Tax=Labrys neptuniae TaxID=376174 RepID=A0ABV3PQ06_9HYPH|nr:SDR family NAD(P)-dependent oxidoreductase [Labrys neptuniae]MDT3375850.1 SDR family NAD(P)-dependent oxidoreductase [Labrys neptuniae]